MAEYRLEVTTGRAAHAGTFDSVYVTLIGSEGESARTELDERGVDFRAGKTGTYTLNTTRPLGQLLLLRMEKEPQPLLPENQWFCSKVVVTTTSDDSILFPCYRWVSRGELIELRGGKAIKVFEEEHAVLVEHRKRELEQRKQLYQWRVFAAGLPHLSSFDVNSELPSEICFSQSKHSELSSSKRKALAELTVKGLKDSTAQWESLEDIKKVFWFKKTPISEYVCEHWTQDEFYGYQFLNGTNPTVIRRCSQLPANFLVTEAMVKPFLEDGNSLELEMKKGHVFLCDYRLMEGLPTRGAGGGALPLSCGMGLFYLNPEKKLLPIAIQLHQQISADSLVFLPSDPESDWLLAKMFLKHADNVHHQVVSHLLNSHLLAEVLAVATLRSLPCIHPLYKLLFPHFCDTLHINTADRDGTPTLGGHLLSGTLGTDGLTELMRRALNETSYSALCLPDNITARGLESVPNFYYREDGMRLWNIINNFTRAVVQHYYPSDAEVSHDSELQDWIRDIFYHGFLGNRRSGIPESFQTVEQVTKFVTMVIFNVSVQHAAVNSGQFDYNSYVPNSPFLLCRPPPTTRGQTSMQTILETLPDVGTSVQSMADAWVVSQKYEDSTPLGSYPQERFEERPPRLMVRELQAELSYLSEDIQLRNRGIELPYHYLDPAGVQNSVSI